MKSERRKVITENIALTTGAILLALSIVVAANSSALPGNERYPMMFNSLKLLAGGLTLSYGSLIMARTRVKARFKK